MSLKLHRAEIAKHNSVDDAWVIVDGVVYDVTSFLESHPGGLSVTEEHLGTDINGIETRTDGKHFEEDVGIDWSKALFGQVGKLGPKYVEWVHSPVNYPLRFFESDLLESLSKSPWWLVPLVWIPVVLYICYQALTGPPSWITLLRPSPPLSATKLLVFLPFGVLIWTLLEYCLHRFVFHLDPPPTSRAWITFHFIIHGQHHKVPFDRMRLVFPPVPAALITLMIYIPFAHVLPMTLNESRALLAGALIGYIMYDLTHYYLHHGSPKPGSYFGNLKTYHVAHHFVNHHKGFGISTKLWDIPFGTWLKAENKKN